MRDLLLIALVAAGVVIAQLPRSRLEQGRVDLGLSRDDAASNDRDAFAPALLLTAGSGVLRPLALNFLMLRSTALAREGRFFESASLARAITSLHPGRPQVWVFQAWNLAYNVSSSFPPRDRFPWVLEGIRLLRDRGLEFNPRSGLICSELSYLFWHKIGARDDEAHVFYKSSLAEIFAAASAAGERAALLAAWKLDEARLEALARRYLDEPGPGLDLRVAATHGLYWADVGLAVTAGGLAGEEAQRARLEIDAEVAVRELLRHGRVVRQPGGAFHAFLPDLRFVAAASRDARREIEEARGDADLEALARSHEEGLATEVVLFAVLSERTALAEKWFEAYRKRLAAADENLDDVLRRSILGDEATDPTAMTVAAAGLLRASLLARLASADDIAAGLERLARAVGRAGVVDESDLLRAAAIDLHRSWNHTESTRAFARRLETILPVGFLEGTAPPAVEFPGVARELPFGLEVLDPLYGGPRS